MHFRQSICFYIFVTRRVGDDEVKSGEEESPAGLSVVEALLITEVCEVVWSVINRMAGPFQMVSPLLQGELDCQQLMITYDIVLLHRRELFGIEGT